MAVFVGIGLALLKEVCHWSWALRFQGPKPGLVLSLPAAFGCRCGNVGMYPALRGFTDMGRNKGRTAVIVWLILIVK